MQITLRGINYYQQTDAIVEDSGTRIMSSLIRQTGYNVFTFVNKDSIVKNLPYSIKNVVSYDDELMLVRFPLIENKSWKVF